MECSEKQQFNKTGKEALENLKIDRPNEEIRRKVLENWDNVAKPLGSMGRFETLTAQIGAICGTEEIDISKKAVLIMCADNGIVEEKVSQSGQEVTLAVVKSMAKKKSSVGKMAERIGADTIPIDIGINCREKITGVWDKKIRPGTENFRKAPAMTMEEACQSILTGIKVVSDCQKMGYKILAAGEMGIGNTTTASAVAAALLGCSVAEVTGRGAGLTEEGLLHKQQVIEEALCRYELKEKDPLTVLMTVGGLDIGGMAGICIGGALFHIPVVLDGVISMTSALLAERIAPGTKEYLLPSHKGKEPAMEKLMRALFLKPVIDGEMALGEGTGAVMMLALLDMALGVYQDRTTFGDISIEKYKKLI